MLLNNIVERNRRWDLAEHALNVWLPLSKMSWLGELTIR